MALVRKNPDGTGSIVYGTNSTSAVTSVLAMVGKALRENAAKAAEENAANYANEIKRKNAAALTAEMANTLGGNQPAFTPQLHVSAAQSQPVPA